MLFSAQDLFISGSQSMKKAKINSLLPVAKIHSSYVNGYGDVMKQLEMLSENIFSSQAQCINSQNRKQSITDFQKIIFRPGAKYKDSTRMFISELAAVSCSKLCFEVIRKPNGNITTQIGYNKIAEKMVTSSLRNVFPYSLSVRKSQDILNKLVHPGSDVLEYYTREKFFEPISLAGPFLYSLLHAFAEIQTGYAVFQLVFEKADDTDFTTAIRFLLDFEAQLNKEKDEGKTLPSTYLPHLAEKASEIDPPYFYVTLRLIGDYSNILSVQPVINSILFGKSHLNSYSTGELPENQIQAILDRESYVTQLFLTGKDFGKILSFPEFGTKELIPKGISVSSELPLGESLKKGDILVGINRFYGKKNNVYISLPVDSCYLQGAAGTGKTTLFANLVLQLIDKGYGCLVIDSHDHLSNLISSNVPKNKIDKIIILDYSLDAFTPCANMLDVNLERGKFAADLTYSSKCLFNDPSVKAPTWGFRIERLLTMLYFILIRQGCLLDYKYLLTKKDSNRRQKLLEGIKDFKEVYNFFMYVIPKIRYDYWQAAYDRISSFFLNKYTAKAFSILDSRLDITKILKSGTTVIVRLPEAKIGYSACNYTGSIIYTVFASMGIAANLEKDYFICCDEHYRYQIDLLKMALLTQSRKFKVHQILACQTHSTAQVDKEFANIIENCRNFFTFRSSYEDSLLNSKKMREIVSCSELQSLRRGEVVARLNSSDISSFTTLPLKMGDNEITEAILNNSIRKYYIKHENSKGGNGYEEIYV